MSNDYYEQQRRMDAERARQAEMQRQADARRADQQRQDDARRADMQRQEDARRADAQRQASDRLYHQQQEERRRQQQQANEDRRQQEFRAEQARQQEQRRQQQQRDDGDARRRADEQRQAKDQADQRRWEEQRRADDARRQQQDQQRLRDGQRQTEAQRQADAERRHVSQQPAPAWARADVSPPPAPVWATPNAYVGSGGGGDAPPMSAPAYVPYRYRRHRTMIGVLVKALVMTVGGSAVVAASANLATNSPAARPYVMDIQRPVIDARAQLNVGALCLVLCALGAIRTARRKRTALLFAVLTPVAAALGWQAWHQWSLSWLTSTVNGRLLLGLSAVMAAILIRGGRGKPFPPLSWGPRLARGLAVVVLVSVVGVRAWESVTGRQLVPPRVIASLPPDVASWLGPPPGPLPASDPAVAALLGTWRRDGRPGDQVTFRQDGTGVSAWLATADRVRDADAAHVGRWVQVAFHLAPEGRLSVDGLADGPLTLVRMADGGIRLRSTTGEELAFHRLGTTAR